MPVTRAAFGRLLEPGLRQVYIKSLQDQEEEWMRFFQTAPSQRKFEEVLSNVAFGAMPVKPEGISVVYEDPSQGWYTTYTHLSYGLGFIVTRETYEDDLYGQIKAYPKHLKRSAIQTREVTAAGVFNNGFTDSAAFVGATGEPLFGDSTSKTHPRKDGGTMQNQLTTAADISHSSIITMCNLLEDQVDEKGLPLFYKPRKVIIPLELKWDARTLLQSYQLPGSANNDHNSLLDEELMYYVWHYLTDADAWFICTDQDQVNIRAFVRRPDDLELGSDFDTQNAKYLATQRISFGYDDPRGIVGSPGA